jgi:hypothetical protein
MSEDCCISEGSEYGIHLVLEKGLLALSSVYLLLSGIKTIVLTVLELEKVDIALLSDTLAFQGALPIGLALWIFYGFVEGRQREASLYSITPVFSLLLTLRLSSLSLILESGFSIGFWVWLALGFESLICALSWKSSLWRRNFNIQMSKQPKIIPVTFELPEIESK